MFLCCRYCRLKIWNDHLKMMIISMLGLTFFYQDFPWWHHQMETFSALLALRAGNSPVPGEFPTQRPVTRSSDVFFDLRLNKRLSKQSWGWWLETQSDSLWRHCNASKMIYSWLSLCERNGQMQSIYSPPSIFAHDDVIKWKHFPRYWPIVRGIHRSRWIPRTKASDAELWCFLWSAFE